MLWVVGLTTGLTVLLCALALADPPGTATPITPPTTAEPSTAAASAVVPSPTTAPVDYGPDVVMLKELVNEYEPVPFEHKKHAAMAEMHGGCSTCHHSPPSRDADAAAAADADAVPTTQPAVTVPPITQDHASDTPACKSCHPVAAKDANIHMPSLKGAYHRQCLNCHRDWMGENACLICHKVRDGSTAMAKDPTPGDIVGRMHPPIPEPDERSFKARYTPAAGGQVLFRHKQHTVGYGIKCASCHRESNCISCHQKIGATSAGPRPVQPARSWQASHEPCISCHRQARCNHCHYQDGQLPPPVFDHASTGQLLDKDHTDLACQQCHAGLRTAEAPSCGDSSCHREGKPVTFPEHRPGDKVSKPEIDAGKLPATQPADLISSKPTLERIRR
ncbi:MAG: cytochrome c3 family protein [Phycisphaeraceae bacterium]